MGKKLAVVISCINAQKHLDLSTKYLIENSDLSITDIYVFDNGSDVPLQVNSCITVVRSSQNIGGNGALPYMFNILSKTEKYEIIAYLHCDLIVRELGWDKRVVSEFNKDNLLALVGFVGSDQFDELGGRGSGTRLNYLGEFYEGFGQATPAEVHGIRSEGLTPAANLDHCSLIFRTNYYNTIVHEVAYCPTHFYDRALAAHCNYRGWHVAHLGISVDHFSGGTAAGAASQEALIRNWLDSEGLSYSDGLKFMIAGGNPSQLLPSSLERSDVVAYRESERRFWKVYRDQLHMVPFFVNADYSKTYWSHNGIRWVPRSEHCMVCTWNKACERHNV